jgi:hypothetical protein
MPTMTIEPTSGASRRSPPRHGASPEPRSSLVHCRDSPACPCLCARGRFDHEIVGALPTRYSRYSRLSALVGACPPTRPLRVARAIRPAIRRDASRPTCAVGHRRGPRDLRFVLSARCRAPRYGWAGKRSECRCRGASDTAGTRGRTSHRPVARRRRGSRRCCCSRAPCHRSPSSSPGQASRAGRRSKRRWGSSCRNRAWRTAGSPRMAGPDRATPRRPRSSPFDCNTDSRSTARRSSRRRSSPALCTSPGCHPRPRLSCRRA